MKYLKIFLISLFILATFVLGAVLFVVNNKIVDFSPLEQYTHGNPTVLLDDEGQEWARFQIDRRDPVSLEKIPKNLINALLAIEDGKFFNHCGLSFKGIARAIFRNICSGAKVEGASTITQQLVRLLFLDAKKTFIRKIKEQIYTLLVESQFSKDQILETYLNNVCFGRGVYGVQAACKRFWNKDISQISLDQAAMLAGNVQRPERFWPFEYPFSAKRRRDLVLSRMKKLGFITEVEYLAAIARPIKLVDAQNKNIAPYLKEYIRIFLEDLIGKEALYTGGFVVQTTLSSKVQELAQKSFSDNIALVRKNICKSADGGLISIEVSTGQIKALIGGVDFAASQYNRAFAAKRQIGSVFKIILYAQALISGKSFADTCVDEPIEVEDNGKIWSPKNAAGDFEGQITLAHALSVSNNIVSVKTLLEVGADSVANLAKKFKFSQQINPYPSLALGCLDSTLKEATCMFNTFANDGVYVEPYCIKWIKNNLGQKVFKSYRKNSGFFEEDSTSERVISSRVSGQVSKVLQLGLKRVKKNHPQKWFNCEAIGKTGTTNDSRVCWFVGSTPTLTTGVYVGRDDNRPMGVNIYPIRTAFPIWIGLNREIDFGNKRFSYDSSLKEVCVNSKTGQQALNATDPDAITIFI